MATLQTTRKLQKLLIKSWGAKCLAVRRVTQDNTGKKTAGVDGVKSLTPKQRLELVSKLRLSSKVDPTRRVWVDVPPALLFNLSVVTKVDRLLKAGGTHPDSQTWKG